MSALRFHCRCGQLIVIPLLHAGRRGTCPACQRDLLSPQLVPQTSASATPRTAPQAPAARPAPRRAAARPRGPKAHIPTREELTQLLATRSFDDPLPLLPLNWSTLGQGRRTTAVLRRAAELPREKPIPRPRFDVSERNCTDCAEPVNARAVLCLYCQATLTPLRDEDPAAPTVERNRRTLGGRRRAERARSLGLIGLAVPLFGPSFVALLYGLSVLTEPAEPPARALKDAWIGVAASLAGLLISSVVAGRVF